MKRWLFLISIGVFGALFIRKFAVEGIYIATPSMEPTLLVDSNYFMDKVSFVFRKPRRGEIVVFPSPIGEDIDLVKRIVGLPGEKIAIKNKQVFINGQLLPEPYARFKRKDEILVGDNIDEVEIPRESYFVMGDNRDESGDSATWKDSKTGAPVLFIVEATIKGRLMGVLE